MLQWEQGAESSCEAGLPSGHPGVRKDHPIPKSISQPLWSPLPAAGRRQPAWIAVPGWQFSFS